MDRQRNGRNSSGRGYSSRGGSRSYSGGKRPSGGGRGRSSSAARSRSGARSRSKVPPVKSATRKIFEWVEALVEAALVVFILFFLLWPLKVDGTSMEPTLKAGDRIAVSRVMSFFDLVNTGDVVICKVQDGNEKIEVVKRVIGKPNDIITISEGKVTVNGILIEENYVGDARTYPDTFIVLGSDEYFILGDNRMVSSDSRNLGPIKKDDIVAKVIFQFYPFDSLSFFP